jgi:cation diffusion facilitator CzcD-associated flavoprotein CzcO
VHDHGAEIRQVMHETTNGHPFRIETRSAFDVSDAERARIYEAAWEKGGLQFRAGFQDLLFDKKANDTAADFIKAKIRGIVTDPKTAAILADIDHPYAAKRPPIDTDYFETFNRPNVSLVDVRADPIERITKTGLKTRSGAEHPLDIIVFATGFDAMTGPLLRLNVVGRDGVALKDAWAAGPRTYLGLQVAGFPNLFTVTGPGSPSVLCNMPVAIEQHVEWITDCIAHLRAHQLDRIEANPDAVDRWVDENNAAANATLLPQVQHSWYLGANVPGKPRVFMPYAGGMAHYRKLCQEIAARGYDGFTLSRAAVPA